MFAPVQYSKTFQNLAALRAKLLPYRATDLPAGVTADIEQLINSINAAMSSNSETPTVLEGAYLSDSALIDFVSAATKEGNWVKESAAEWGDGAFVVPVGKIKARFNVSFDASLARKIILTRPVDWAHEAYGVEFTLLPGHALVSFIATRLHKSHPCLLTLAELADVLVEVIKNDNWSGLVD